MTSPTARRNSFDLPSTRSIRTSGISFGSVRARRCNAKSRRRPGYRSDGSYDPRNLILGIEVTDRSANDLVQPAGSHVEWCISNPIGTYRNLLGCQLGPHILRSDTGDG